MTFDNERFRGHTTLCEIDLEGQRRLTAARVAAVGCGGLASTALTTLAASGIGAMTLIDGDRVETSNLQRQTIHTPADTGSLKVESARGKLLALSPGMTVDTVARMLTADNAATLLAGADIVLDCTDSFESKAAVAHACVAAGTPCVTAAVSRFSAQVMTWAPGAPCYGCLYGLTPPDDDEARQTSCAAAGIFSGVVALAGTLMACEAMKYIVGTGDLLTGRMLVIDTLTMKFHELRTVADPACPLCSPSNRPL